MKCQFSMTSKTKDIVKLVLKVVSYVITLILGALGGSTAL